MSFAAVIFTDCTELDYSGFPPEVLKISGAPSTPNQLVHSINPATAQAILARAARAANRRAVQPTAISATNTTTPNRPTQPPGQAAIPTGATTFSDSEEEYTAMATIQGNPLAYTSAFKEREFILKQVMKARITKKGSRTDEGLLAFQTDQVIKTAQLDTIQIDKIMELQASTSDLGPIKTGSHMQNKRMSPTKWSAVEDILHMILLIARALRIPSDSWKAREMLQQMHEDEI